jgi:hypothetical protein
MIYNGQEFGEKGMDNEGFSGMDGRTSIFDYWRMDSVRRWANNGCFDGKLLNEEEHKLRAFYKKMLSISKNEKAISMGRFYGLAFCNYDNPYYPSGQMLTYLRKYENELILVCINFDNRAYNVRIKIPQDAFDVLQIPDNTVSIMKDLLSGDESICSLTHTCPFEVATLGLSAKMLKFNYIYF